MSRHKKKRRFPQAPPPEPAPFESRFANGCGIIFVGLMAAFGFWCVLAYFLTGTVL